MKDLILSLVEQGKYAEARKEIVNVNAVDVAQLFEEVEQTRLLIMFRMLPKDIALGVFTHMSSDLQKRIITSMTDNEAVSILDELFLDDVIDLLEEMPANIVKKLLKNTDKETRELINQFLNYPEDSAGSLMTIEYVDLVKEMTVS